MCNFVSRSVSLIDELKPAQQIEVSAVDGRRRRKAQYIRAQDIKRLSPVMFFLYKTLGSLKTYDFCTQNGTKHSPLSQLFLYFFCPTTSCLKRKLLNVLSSVTYSPSHHQAGARMINIQSTLCTAPDLRTNISLDVLFGSNGNSYTVST